MRRHSSTSVRACVLGLVIVACQVFLPETSWGQKKPKESAGQKHVFSGPAPAHPFDIVLARPTAKSITASVMVARESQGYIAYGAEKGQLASKSQIMKLPAGTPVEFLVKDLVPDTGYHYRLHYRESVAPDYVTSGEFSFHTQRKSGSHFVFTIQADSHLDQGTRPAVYERTLANALADGTDSHLDLGDTFMTDKYPNYADSLPQYIAQRYYLGLAGCSAPVFLVAGNHDGERLDRYNGTPNCMPVWAALTRRKYFPPPVPNSFYSGSTAEVKYAGRPENYFAFEWGDAQLIALDPFWTTARKGKVANEGNWSRTLGQAQYQWLAKTLAASKARYKFVFIHHLVGGLDESARGGSEAAVLYEGGARAKTARMNSKLGDPAGPCQSISFWLSIKSLPCFTDTITFLPGRNSTTLLMSWSLNRGTRGSIDCAMWMSMVTFAAISCRRLATFVFRCQPTGQPWRMCGLTYLRWKPLSGRMGK